MYRGARRYKTARRRVGLGLLLILMAAVPCLGAGLTRAKRSEAPPPAASLDARRQTPPQSAGGPVASERATIVGPSTLVPVDGLGGGYAQPGVAVTQQIGAPGEGAPAAESGAESAPKTVPTEEVGKAAPTDLEGVTAPVVVAPDGAGVAPPTPDLPRVGVVSARRIAVQPGGQPGLSAPPREAAARGQDVGVTATRSGAGAGSGGRLTKAAQEGQAGAVPGTTAQPAELEPRPGRAPGETPGGPTAELTLTPEEAARLALANSLDLQITAASIREAQAQLRKTFGLDDFRVTLSATYGRRGPIPTFTMPGPGGEPRQVKLGNPTIQTEQLQVTKSLYSRKINRTQEVALKGLETRKLSKAVVERALDLAARQAAFAVLRAGQLAEVAQQRATAVAAHLDLTKKLHSAGVVAKFEVVQAETELARAQGDVIAARTAFDTAKAALKRVLTLPQDSTVLVKYGAPLTPPPGDQQALIRLAWEQRPEIRAAEAAIKLAEANVRLAAATSDLSVNLAGGLTGTKPSFGSEAWSWQVAIAAELPILDAKLEKNELRAAREQLEQAKLELEKSKQEIALDVAQNCLAVEDARERLEVARQGVAEAEERLRIAKVRYENGIALGVEVLDAETALAAARAEVVNSTYGLQLAISQLRSSVGLWGGTEGGEG